MIEQFQSDHVAGCAYFKQLAPATVALLHLD